MKKLYVLRHAKSSWQDDSMDDFDRPLNDRGLRDAPEIGKRLAARGVTPDLILSSSSVRTLATINIIAPLLGYSGKIVQQRELYLAEDEQIFTILKKCDQAGDPASVMIVGHNPGLTDFVNQLFSDPIDSMPTCSILGGTINIASWKALKWRTAKREFFEFPNG